MKKGDKMKLYTTIEAAALLAAAQPTITLHARKLGLARRGRDYLFADADIEALRRSMDASVVGRPRTAPTE